MVSYQAPFEYFGDYTNMGIELVNYSNELAAWPNPIDGLTADQSDSDDESTFDDGGIDLTADDDVILAELQLRYAKSILELTKGLAELRQTYRSTPPDERKRLEAFMAHVEAVVRGGLGFLPSIADYPTSGGADRTIANAMPPERDNHGRGGLLLPSPAGSTNHMPCNPLRKEGIARKQKRFDQPIEAGRFDRSNIVVEPKKTLTTSSQRALTS
ncbi:hypothetical protein BDZ97DRAFT_1933043 [Flammula alnicola]|nr:hypothetical protein BDZ97DRAFT_1933043 [Flammula alnicola]